MGRRLVFRIFQLGMNRDNYLYLDLYRNVYTNCKVENSTYEHNFYRFTFLPAKTKHDCAPYVNWFKFI